MKKILIVILQAFILICSNESLASDPEEPKLVLKCDIMYSSSGYFIKVYDNCTMNITYGDRWNNQDTIRNVKLRTVVRFPNSDLVELQALKNKILEQPKSTIMDQIRQRDGSRIDVFIDNKQYSSYISEIKKFVDPNIIALYEKLQVISPWLKLGQIQKEIKLK